MHMCLCSIPMNVAQGRNITVLTLKEKVWFSVNIGRANANMADPI